MPPGFAFVPKSEIGLSLTEAQRDRCGKLTAHQLHLRSPFTRSRKASSQASSGNVEIILRHYPIFYACARKALTSLRDGCTATQTTGWCSSAALDALAARNSFLILGVALKNSSLSHAACWRPASSFDVLQHSASGMLAVTRGRNSAEFLRMIQSGLSRP